MPLVIQLVSFSYKQSLPKDESSNGGGFLFDCRCLPNPGRFAEYKHLSGQDSPVIEFLQQQPAVNVYFQQTKTLAELAVDNYIERGFDHLLIGYGCTGGQHRSVYNAERLAKDLTESYASNDKLVEIQLSHINKANWLR